MGLGGGDADPNPEMNVWTTTGTSHLWHLARDRTGHRWEREIDQLMQRQMVTLDYAKRKQLYDRVQQLIGEQLPFIFFATPDVLAAAAPRVGNFRPALLDPCTFWNAEELYIRTPVESAGCAMTGTAARRGSRARRRPTGRTTDRSCLEAMRKPGQR